MVAKRRGLGRGLDALLAKPPDVATDEAVPIMELPIHCLCRSPLQPRRHFDDQSLQELAESIRVQGVVQPVLVRPAKLSGQYEIVAGERRWRAARLSGLDTVPVVVRDMEDRVLLCAALVENMQREDLGILEEAEGLARLVNDFGLSHGEAARTVGRSRSAVSNMLRLLSLQDEIKAMLDKGQMEMGHARTLLRLTGMARVQAARQVIQKGMTVRATEAMVDALLSKSDAVRTPADAPAMDPDLRALHDRLSACLGAPVTIRHRSAGGGSIIIRYHSLDELDGILQKFS